MPFFKRRLPKILEKLIKALFEWLARLWYEMVEYLLEHLMDLFHTDLTYFAERVPVINDIGTIFFAVGWALLIGNLVFQATRSMASGVGIEAEEPGRLFLRTAMFSFLLMVSRQICEIGLGLSSTIMDMLQIPNAITFDPFGEDTFDMLPNAGWIVVILVNVIIQWQTIKLFFEVAERYVILCVLTYCAPLAFAMGGSKSTGEIFRGWLRMFASMCALMVFNLMFVKLLISAMSNAPNGTAIIPWMMLIVGIVRMAKKMDGIILRIGLNPALTGDPLGTRFPGMLTAMTLRSVAQMVTRTAAQGMPSTGHGSHAPPASGSFMQHSGKQGSQSAGTAGASAQGGAAAGAAGVAGAAIHVAGSGARAMSDLASFRNRHGAGDPASMRQVSQTISVDADDWEDSSSVSSIRSQNQSVSEANAVRRMMVSPVSPAIPPLPADFGRLGAPKTESALRTPVMPTHRMDTAPGLSVTPVQPAAAMPRTPEQVFPSNTGTSGAPQQAVSGTPSAHPPRTADHVAPSSRDTSKSRIPVACTDTFAQRKQIVRDARRIYGAECAGMPAGVSNRIGRTFIRHRSGSRCSSCHRGTGTYCVRGSAQPDCSLWFGQSSSIAAEPHDTACAAGTTGDAPDRGNSGHRRQLAPRDAGRAAATDRCIDIWTTDTAHSGTDHTASSSAAAVAYGKGTNASHAGGIACIGRRRQPTCGFPRLRLRRIVVPLYPRLGVSIAKYSRLPRYKALFRPISVHRIWSDGRRLRTKRVSCAAPHNL